MLGALNMDSMSTHLANLNFGHSYCPEKSYMRLSLDINMKEEAFIGLELFFLNFIDMCVLTGIGDYYSYIITKVILVQSKIQYF